MGTWRGLAFTLSAVVAAQGPARAAGTAQTTVRNAYATYLRSGALTGKHVAALKPYLEPGLYALLVRWMSEPSRATIPGEECTFDADPFLATQAGPGSLPVTLGAMTTFAGHAALPVAIPLKPVGRASIGISHTLVELEGGGGQYRILDIVPVLDGKPYPVASMRAMLTQYAKDPRCH
jgi:hypothetical protein